jgi:hypothetical protein
MAKNLLEKPQNKPQEETSRARKNKQKGKGRGNYTDRSHTPPNTPKNLLHQRNKKQPAGEKKLAPPAPKPTPRTARLSTKNTHRDPMSTRKISMD